MNNKSGVWLWGGRDMVIDIQHHVRKWGFLVFVACGKYQKWIPQGGFGLEAIKSQVSTVE